MSKPIKPPVTRRGRTHKIVVGETNAYFTINRDAAGNVIEIFAKANNGAQGHLDIACRLASLGLQGRCTVDTIIKHLRHDKCPPQGGPGQPSSVYDALARVMEAEREG
jgi:hypothetical protein